MAGASGGAGGKRRRVGGRGVEGCRCGKRRRGVSACAVDRVPCGSQRPVVVDDYIVDAVKRTSVAFDKYLGWLFEGAAVVNLDSHSRALHYIPDVSVCETCGARRGCSDDGLCPHI